VHDTNTLIAILDQASRQLKIERQRADTAEALASSMKIDVEAHERLTKADGSLCPTDAAKTLAMRPNDLFRWLARNGWIYKRPGCAHWIGYQDKCNRG
jgi:phage antirepressor YoqD-like protein